jgi:hypothetical protein
MAAGDATLTGLAVSFGAFTQGSSLLATLGWVMQSLRDWANINPFGIGRQMLWTLTPWFD